MTAGISVRDTAMMCAVPEANVRKWLSRGTIERGTDGQIDPFAVLKWWDIERDQIKAKRNPIHTARHNPYAA